MLYYRRPTPRPRSGRPVAVKAMHPRMPTSDAGRLFIELLAVMARLRDEGGCPWDREQTRDSLRPFLVEETYEVLEALEEGVPARIREELGDLLFQIVFHVQLADERHEFSMVELLAGLIGKMERRHPHVFGERRLDSAREVLAQWEAIKRAEHGLTRPSALDGVPRTLPGLLRAQRIQDRASHLGFDWPAAAPALEKVREEADELAEALGQADPARVRAEVGDLLFAAVNVARLADTDPEGALQDAVERFRARFRHMEAAARSEDRDLSALTPPEMERLWAEAKSQEKVR
jgi:tetrapyrrole methylase family protein / MazG family protein